MRKTVKILTRDIIVSVSDTASRELIMRETPIVAEMELYFSCLIRKRVRFHDKPYNLAATEVMDKLQVAFHPVMTAACGNDYAGTEPPLTDFPIQKPEAFVPHWLKIDYHDNQWQGEFGF